MTEQKPLLTCDGDWYHAIENAAEDLDYDRLVTIFKDWALNEEKESVIGGKLFIDVLRGAARAKSANKSPVACMKLLLENGALLNNKINCATRKDYPYFDLGDIITTRIEKGAEKNMRKAVRWLLVLGCKCEKSPYINNSSEVRKVVISKLASHNVMTAEEFDHLEALGRTYVSAREEKKKQGAVRSKLNLPFKKRRVKEL